ncbi:unnamed protein product, partial [Ectocarpus sp. 12 AP-2014]
PTRIPTSLHHPAHPCVHDVVRRRSQYSSSSRVLFDFCLRLDPFVYPVCVEGRGGIGIKRRTWCSSMQADKGSFQRESLRGWLLISASHLVGFIGGCYVRVSRYSQR